MPELANADIKEQRDEAFRFRGQSITYRETNDTTDLTTGVVTPNDTDTIIGTGTDNNPGVLVSSVSDVMVSNSGGKYQVGDRIFKIRNSDMPETPPDTTNQIIYDSGTYNIISHRRSVDGNVWYVHTRLP